MCTSNQGGVHEGHGFMDSVVLFDEKTFQGGLTAWINRFFLIFGSIGHCIVRVFYSHGKLSINCNFI